MYIADLELEPVDRVEEGTESVEQSSEECKESGFVRMRRVVKRRE
jgi:hypothetical protein